jgi:hypothetical protein
MFLTRSGETVPPLKAGTKSEAFRAARQHKERPLLALFGHGAMSAKSPFSGVKRKSHFGTVRSAFDPTRTSPSRCADVYLVRQPVPIPSSGAHSAKAVVPERRLNEGT